MEFNKLKAALTNAQENMWDGVIVTHNRSTDFIFIKGDSSKDDIIEYDSRTKTITILGKTRFAYIDCDKVECIEVYGN